MKVLLQSVGNAPACFVCVAAYPENYAKGRIGEHEVITFGSDKVKLIINCQ